MLIFECLLPLSCATPQGSACYILYLKPEFFGRCCTDVYGFCKKLLGHFYIELLVEFQCVTVLKRALVFIYRSRFRDVKLKGM